MPKRPTRSDALGAVPLTRLPGSGQAEDELEVASVVGVFGVRGEVRLYLHHRGSSLFDTPRQVVLVTPDGRRFRTTLSARPGAGKRVLGRIEGIDQRELAAALKGTRIVVPTASLPEPDPGEFYVFQLLGAPVMVGDEEVGTLVDVHATEGGDVLEIEVDGHRQFVPSRREHVAEVDPEARCVVLHPGALESE